MSDPPMPGNCGFRFGPGEAMNVTKVMRSVEFPQWSKDSPLRVEGVWAVKDARH